jgi:hypothetical protein
LQQLCHLLYACVNLSFRPVCSIVRFVGSYRRIVRRFTIRQIRMVRTKRTVRENDLRIVNLFCRSIIHISRLFKIIHILLPRSINTLLELNNFKHFITFRAHVGPLMLYNLYNHGCLPFTWKFRWFHTVKVNGTNIFRRPNRNFSGTNGLFEKVVLSYRLEHFNRWILLHLHFFYFFH